MGDYAHWLLATGRFLGDPAALLSGLAKQLCDDGLDVIRMNVQPHTLHPEISTMLYIWRPGEEQSELRGTAAVVEKTRSRHEFGTVEEIALGYTATVPDAFRSSPFFTIESGAPRVRSRIEPDAATYDYPILRDLAAVGATEYVAWPLRLGDGAVSYFSLVTRRPGGLTDADVERLEAMLDPLAMCIELHEDRHIARSLLRTYLGTSPGDAVLAGRVRRGDVERVEAAIWFSDLRGFTNASSTIDSAELVAWLNEYFSAMARPITRHRGEILKFVGDAILAIFPVTPERPAAAACEAALQAAVAGNAELDALNQRRAARGLPALGHGIGLHVGEVMYGNIGADRRLDFTVIGKAVNLASRIESLCGKLGRRTLASADVAALVGGSLSPVGTFELKGLPGSHVVYGA